MMRNIYLLLCLLIVSCSTEPKEIVPDVSHINLDYQVVRFEEEMTNSVQSLKEKHPDFCDPFFKYIIPIYRKKNPDSAYIEIVTTEEFQILRDSTSHYFEDFDRIKLQFDDAFKLLNHYLPAIDVPDIYTFVSGFAYQQFIFQIDSTKNGLGIGLDMFLGSDFRYGSIAPENSAFSDYLTRAYNKEHMVKKSINALLEDYNPPPKKFRLLDQMIYNGKKLYAINKILPEVHDTIVMEYSKKQWDWAQENEIEMWAYFLKENLFYESNSQKINKYINPSPHSPGMPPSAPGRTANFLGWKIVDTYMKRFPDTTLDQLMQLPDAQEILQKSRYKPKK